MKWSWKRKAEPPSIPRYEPPVVIRQPIPKPDDGIIVEEIDTSAMTRTGIHRAWNRLTGRFKDE